MLIMVLDRNMWLYYVRLQTGDKKIIINGDLII